MAKIFSEMDLGESRINILEKKEKKTAMTGEKKMTTGTPPGIESGTSRFLLNYPNLNGDIHLTFYKVAAEKTEKVQYKTY